MYELSNNWRLNLSVRKISSKLSINFLIKEVLTTNCGKQHTNLLLTYNNVLTATVSRLTKIGFTSTVQKVLKLEQLKEEI